MIQYLEIAQLSMMLGIFTRSDQNLLVNIISENLF